MAHFASTDWHNPSGLVAQMENTAVTGPTATGRGSTDDTDRLTYTVLRTGLYRISTGIKTSTVSDANTSDVAVAQVSYNDGTARSNADIFNVNVDPGDIDVTSANTNLGQTMLLKANSGTDIVITVSHTIVGAKAAGSMDLYFAIEAV